MVEGKVIRFNFLNSISSIFSTRYNMVFKINLIKSLKLMLVRYLDINYVLCVSSYSSRPGLHNYNDSQCEGILATDRGHVLGGVVSRSRSVPWGSGRAAYQGHWTVNYFRKLHLLPDVRLSQTSVACLTIPDGFQSNEMSIFCLWLYIA